MIYATHLCYNRISHTIRFHDGHWSFARVQMVETRNYISWIEKCHCESTTVNFTTWGFASSYDTSVRVVGQSFTGSLVWSGILTVYPKKYAHGFCFAVLCCGYILTDFPISIRLTSLALWQSNDCPSVSKATLMNMDKYFKWIHYERLHNHNKAKHNKTVWIFLGIYCKSTGT